MKCEDCNFEITGKKYLRGYYKDGGNIIVCERCMREELRRKGKKTDRLLKEFELK